MAVIVSKVSYIIFTHCSKCSPPARTKISYVDELRWRIKNKWTVWITLFIELAVGDISRIWCKGDVTYYIRLTIFETITAMFVPSLFNDSLYTRNYSTALTVQSVTSNFSSTYFMEVGNSCIVLLIVSFTTGHAPIYIEMGSYLTSAEHKYVGNFVATLCILPVCRRNWSRIIS